MPHIAEQPPSKTPETHSDPALIDEHRDRLWTAALKLLSNQPLSFDEETRRILYGVLICVLVLMLLGFGTRHMIHAQWLSAIVYFVTAGYAVTSVVVLRSRPSGLVIYRVGVIFTCLLFVYFGAQGEEHGYRALWVFAYPVFALYMVGAKEGLFYTLGLLVAWLGFFFLPTNLTGAAEYSPDFIIRFVASYLAILLTAYFVEGTRRMYIAALDGQRRKLHIENAELTLSEEEMRDLAHQDHLTGIANRRAILAQLEREIVRARQTGQVLSIAVLDIDYFKAINDKFGHAGGDEVLIQFAERIGREIRDNDCFGRYGGEEFLLIFPGAPPAAVVALVDRIRRFIAETPFLIDGGAVTVTFSAGTAAAINDGLTADPMLKDADTALYQAKSRGRNRVHASSAGIVQPS